MVRVPPERGSSRPLSLVTTVEQSAPEKPLVHVHEGGEPAHAPLPLQFGVPGQLRSEQSLPL